MVTEIEIAWLAGLFEDEGTIYLARNGYWRLRIIMSDEDVVRRAHLTAGLGTFRWHGANRKTNLVGFDPANGKEMWDWQVGAQRDVRALLQLLLPFFGQRRSEKAIQAIADIDAWETRHNIRYAKSLAS